MSTASLENVWRDMVQDHLVNRRRQAFWQTGANNLFFAALKIFQILVGIFVPRLHFEYAFNAYTGLIRIDFCGMARSCGGVFSLQSYQDFCSIEFLIILMWRIHRGYCEPRYSWTPSLLDFMKLANGKNCNVYWFFNKKGLKLIENFSKTPRPRTLDDQKMQQLNKLDLGCPDWVTLGHLFLRMDITRNCNFVGYKQDGTTVFFNDHCNGSGIFCFPPQTMSSMPLYANSPQSFFGGIAAVLNRPRLPFPMTPPVPQPSFRITSPVTPTSPFDIPPGRPHFPVIPHAPMPTPQPYHFLPHSDILNLSHSGQVPSGSTETCATVSSGTRPLSHPRIKRKATATIVRSPSDDSKRTCPSPPDSIPLPKSPTLVTEVTNILHIPEAGPLSIDTNPPLPSNTSMTTDSAHSPLSSSPGSLIICSLSDEEKI